MLLKLGAAIPWLVCTSQLSSFLSAGRTETAAKLSPADDTFLEELQRNSFRYFWECGDPGTGLVKDRNCATGKPSCSVASTAATGFGLTGLCIADQRGWLNQGEARRRAETTLRFLCERLPHQQGFFYHFVHWQTGERVEESEVSSIDTAILLCGVLACRQHFGDERIRAYATEIYDRINWPWLLQEGPMISHGWNPENGFLKSRWDSYSEHMMLYLLALGANRHPIPRACWHAWRRPQYEYEGLSYIYTQAPLFAHQYSHAWFDFRGRRDMYADYFENSVKATISHRRFCAGLHADFPHFDENMWGITASDSANGYVAWGGPPVTGPLDGTLVPCAAGGSISFLPGDSVGCLRAMRERYGDRIWGRYGFVDAFNPASKWVGPDVLGIDAGITLLMAENARTGFVWRTFMQNEEVQRGMKKAGFRS